MPKGRRFAPPTGRDGIWFQHRGYETYQQVPQRFLDTSTGTMLTTPFVPESTNRPQPPPEPYFNKTYSNFRSSNDFSVHDNRHSFQDHGVYFGNGQDTRFLGKNFIRPQERQHHTEKDYLKHFSRKAIDHDYNTSYSTTYQGQPTAEPPKFRRFPKVHKEGDSANSTLNTTTTDWFQHPNFRTPMQVLASSQEPFLSHNAWKYSYNSLNRVYPPYDEIKKKPVDVYVN